MVNSKAKAASDNKLPAKSHIKEFLPEHGTAYYKWLESETLGLNKLEYLI